MVDQTVSYIGQGSTVLPSNTKPTLEAYQRTECIFHGIDGIDAAFL